MDKMRYRGTTFNCGFRNKTVLYNLQAIELLLGAYIHAGMQWPVREKTIAFKLNLSYRPMFFVSYRPMIYMTHRCGPTHIEIHFESC